LKLRKKQIEYGLLAAVSLVAFLAVLYAFTGKNCFSVNRYQTYAFQAESWTKGRLDLEENYSWLEIAEYNGKYYCSFPPFPSYVLFPFAFIWGHDTPDAFILLVFDILAVIFLYKIALHFYLSPNNAMLTALGSFIGSNMVFVMFDPSVWFVAQSICFSLSCMSIYCALKDKCGWSLFLWAAAVGCRPMVVVFLPMLIAIFFHNMKSKEVSLYSYVTRNIPRAIPAVLLAISYMALNYFRFGSITEFGHNYLPEFVNVHKQFSLEYLGQNFKMLMHMPQKDDYGRMVVDHFGNINFLLINTVVVVFLLGIFVLIIKRRWKIVINCGCILLMSVAYLIFVMCHATMGGWHFGNRYSNEIIPFVFCGLMMVYKRFPALVKWQLPFAIWGMCLNIVGTVIVYNGLKY